MNYTSEVKDGILMLKLSGDLIAITSSLDLSVLIDDTIEDNLKLCAIDISEIKFINSSGLGYLITLLTKFRNKGGELFLISPSEQVKKLLIIAKLNSIFNIAANQEEAIQKLSKVII